MISWACLVENEPVVVDVLASPTGLVMVTGYGTPVVELAVGNLMTLFLTLVVGVQVTLPASGLFWFWAQALLASFVVNTPVPPVTDRRRCPSCRCTR